MDTPNLFLHSCTGGTFRLFSVWGTTNMATMNIYVQTLYGHIFPFIFGKYLGGKWMDHMVGVCLTSWETA